jgi:hypothetical protein
MNTVSVTNVRDFRFIGSSNNKELTMAPGPKTEVNDTYRAARKKFEEILSNAQARARFESGATKGTIGVVHDEGRKYDKILISYSPDPEARAGKPEVRYFVDRANGEIYGAKSPMAPNLKWYFGTIYEVEKWNWTGHHGVPLDEQAAGVRSVGAYGDYKHFEKVTVAA